MLTSACVKKASVASAKVSATRPQPSRAANVVPRAKAERESSDAWATLKQSSAAAVLAAALLTGSAEVAPAQAFTQQSGSDVTSNVKSAVNDAKNAIQSNNPFSGNPLTGNSVANNVQGAANDAKNAIQSNNPLSGNPLAGNSIASNAQNAVNSARNAVQGSGLSGNPLDSVASNLKGAANDAKNAVKGNNPLSSNPLSGNPLSGNSVASNAKNAVSGAANSLQGGVGLPSGASSDTKRIQRNPNGLPFLTIENPVAPLNIANSIQDAANDAKNAVNSNNPFSGNPLSGNSIASNAENAANSARNAFQGSGLSGNPLSGNPLSSNPLTGNSIASNAKSAANDAKNAVQNNNPFSSNPLDSIASNIKGAANDAKNAVKGNNPLSGNSVASKAKDAVSGAANSLQGGVGLPSGISSDTKRIQGNVNGLPILDIPGNPQAYGRNLQGKASNAATDVKTGTTDAASKIKDSTKGGGINGIFGATQGAIDNANDASGVANRQVASVARATKDQAQNAADKLTSNLKQGASDAKDIINNASK